MSNPTGLALDRSGYEVVRLIYDVDERACGRPSLVGIRYCKVRFLSCLYAHPLTQEPALTAVPSSPCFLHAACCTVPPPPPFPVDVL